MCLFQFWFPQCVCPAVGLLDHRIRLSRTFLPWNAPTASLAVCKMNSEDSFATEHVLVGTFTCQFLNYLFLFERCVCMCESISRVLLFATPWTVARQAPLSMGILQARILEWVAMPFSRGSSQPRDQTQVSCTAGGLFTI